MRTTRSLLRAAALAALVAVVALVSGPAEADGPFAPISVTITPANQNVPTDGQVVVQINLGAFPDPDGLGGYDLALTWDPQVMAFKCAAANCSDGFTNGPLLASTGRPATCFPPDFNADTDPQPEPGYVRVACGTLGAPPPNGATAGGLLTTLRFNACAGSTILTFDRVTLTDPLAEDKDDPPGDDYQYNISGANVTVTGGGEPCPIFAIGDTNCNGVVNAIDAALILQFDAGLINQLACSAQADVNGDGNINAIDALLVLQFDAGLLDQLPP